MQHLNILIHKSVMESLQNYKQSFISSNIFPKKYIYKYLKYSMPYLVKTMAVIKAVIQKRNLGIGRNSLFAGYESRPAFA